MTVLRIAIVCSLMVGCAECPAVLAAAVIVEARFMGSGDVVDDAMIECTVGGATSPGDDSERAIGRYVCYGAPGQYQVRLTRGGVATGRMVDVPEEGSCGLASTQTVEVGVFGP